MTRAMHANPLLDPLFWEHVVERQRQLYLPAVPPRHFGAAEGNGARRASSSDADHGDRAELGAEPEAANAPEKLRAA